MRKGTTKLRVAFAGGIALAFAFAFGFAGVARAQDGRGKELFRLCQQCHGSAGQGNPLVKAPVIAGLPAWYVTAQVKYFQNGARGGHPDDHTGLRMRPMSRFLKTDADVQAVAAYVASLPPAPPKPTLDGDAAKGATAYALCGSCHGQNGQGSQPQGAPPLAGQADWYLLSSLQKFKAGIRGSNPADPFGAVMRGMAMTLPTEQSMLDVIAHIMTLSRK